MLSMSIFIVIADGNTALSKTQVSKMIHFVFERISFPSHTLNNNNIWWNQINPEPNTTNYMRHQLRPNSKHGYKFRFLPVIDSLQEIEMEM